MAGQGRAMQGGVGWESWECEKLDSMERAHTHHAERKEEKGEENEESKQEVYETPPGERERRVSVKYGKGGGSATCGENEGKLIRGKNN